MYILFLLGRIALVAIFLVAGVTKLMDIAGSAKMMEAKFAIPGFAAALATQAESATGMSIYQLLASAVATVEILLALLIIFNVATRFAAFLLLIYVIVVAFYAFDFWNMTADARAAGLSQFLMSVSIMGALLMLFVIGPWRPAAFDEEDEYGT